MSNRKRSIWYLLVTACLSIASPLYAQFVNPLNDTATSYWQLQYPPVDFCSAAKNVRGERIRCSYILSEGLFTAEQRRRRRRGKSQPVTGRIHR